MDEFNKNIAARLKEVRMIFNEGSWLSGDQFAHLVGETGNKIRNYESGRTSIPARLLAELYYRGIAPVYMLTGEGPMFADNERGRELAARIAAKSGEPRVVRIASGADISDGGLDHRVSRVAAGKIPYRADKKNSD